MEHISDQHFLYTYSDTTTYSGPSERMKEKFKSDLIFDKSRRSIFTQEQEFGYICNTTQSVTVRNADGTTSTDLILDVQDGVITFSQYVPIQLSNFNVKLTNQRGETISGNIAEIGSTVYTNSFSVNVDGTAASSYNGFAQTGASGHSWEVNINSTIVPPTTFNYNVTEKTDEHVYFTERSQRTVTFRFYAQDNKMWEKNEMTYISKSLSFYNHVRILEVGNATYSDFYKIYDALNYTNGFTLVSADVKYDTLAGNYTINNFSCNNGPSRYLCLHIPTRLCSLNVITGVLGGASVQEFKRVRTLSYTNGSSYSENYSIYLATGENWKGSSLVIK